MKFFLHSENEKLNLINLALLQCTATCLSQGRKVIEFSGQTEIGYLDNRPRQQEVLKNFQVEEMITERN